MTKAELCRRWNKGPKTIQRYAASGMPYSGTGHNLRFDIAECEAWRAEFKASGWTEAELREGDAFDWVGPTYAGDCYASSQSCASAREHPLE